MPPSFTISYKTYERPFSTALKTAHGIWTHRKGILIQLESEGGKKTYGEIAPIHDFETETQEEALRFCQSLGNTIHQDDIFKIPSTLPCCQFAFESALRMLKGLKDKTEKLKCAGLISGNSDLDTCINKHTEFKVFKVKIGTRSIKDEQAEIIKYLEHSNPLIKLRLDANGSLNKEVCLSYLEKLEPYSDRIEFIEQALPVGQERELQELASQTKIPFALDESINAQTFKHFDSFWTGLYILKPCLLGSPKKMSTWIENNVNRVIFSSSFETQIGEWAAFQLIPQNKWALGWGTSKYFNDNFQTSLDDSFLNPTTINSKSLENIWMHIGNS